MAREQPGWLVRELQRPHHTGHDRRVECHLRQGGFQSESREWNQYFNHATRSKIQISSIGCFTDQSAVMFIIMFGYSLSLNRHLQRMRNPVGIVYTIPIFCSHADFPLVFLGIAHLVFLQARRRLMKENISCIFIMVLVNNEHPWAPYVTPLPTDFQSMRANI